MIHGWTDDPERDAARRDAEWDDFCESRPKCRICGEQIIDNGAYHIRASYYCADCVEDSWEEFDDQPGNN